MRSLIQFALQKIRRPFHSDALEVVVVRADRDVAVKCERKSVATSKLAVLLTKFRTTDSIQVRETDLKMP